MKILHIFNRYLEVGGEELFFRDLGAELSGRHEVEELVFHSEDWRGEGLVGKLSQPLRMCRNPRSLEALDRVLKRFRPDVALLHNVFPVGSLALYERLGASGVPVVQYVHNFRPFSVNGYCWAGGRLEPAGLRKNFLPEVVHGSWQKSRLKTACYAGVLLAGHWRGIWEGVSGWVAISDFMRDRFVEAGISPGKVTSVRHAWEPRCSGQPSAPEGRSLLFMGRLSEEKGVKVLMEAWRRVEARREDGMLEICGSGPLESWVQEQADGMRRVKFHGFVQGEEKLGLVRRARAMVVPSVWWEALGLVVYEAYDACRPVLAAASGGLTETVIHGETGWLHAPGDAEQLAEQMMEALDGEADECTRRGIAGRHWLEQNAGMDEWREKLEDVLNRARKAGSIPG